MSDEFQQRRDREIDSRLQGFPGRGQGPGPLQRLWQKIKDIDLSNVNWPEFRSDPEFRDIPEVEWEQIREQAVEAKSREGSEPNAVLSLIDEAVEGGEDPWGDVNLEGEIPEEGNWNSRSPEQRDPTRVYEQNGQAISGQQSGENEIQYESDMIDVPTDENGYYIGLNFQPSDGPARSEQPELKPVQQKLANMGYYDDEVDGLYGENTRQAVERFIADHNVQGNPEYISEEVYREIMNARQ